MPHIPSVATSSEVLPLQSTHQWSLHSCIRREWCSFTTLAATDCWFYFPWKFLPLRVTVVSYLCATGFWRDWCFTSHIRHQWTSIKFDWKGLSQTSTTAWGPVLHCYLRLLRHQEWRESTPPADSNSRRGMLYPQGEAATVSKGGSRHTHPWKKLCCITLQCFSLSVFLNMYKWCGGGVHPQLLLFLNFTER